MRGTAYAAVVFHRKCPGAKQIRSDRLGRRLKNVDVKIKKSCFQNGKYYIDDRSYHQIDRKENICWFRHNL